MKDDKIKSKAEAIRKCLRTAVSIESKYDMLKNVDSMPIWNFQLIKMLKLKKVCKDFMKIIILYGLMTLHLKIVIINI